MGSLATHAQGFSALMRRLHDSEADRAQRHPRRALALLAIGLVATAVCLAAELWLMRELLRLLPEASAEPADIERLADIGKWIAGATGATLLVRGLLDRAARRRHLGAQRIAALALIWIVVAVGIHRSLVVVTDAIVDSLPGAARQDAVLIALYRKNVHDGTIGDPDFSPGIAGTLDDLQRVKAINAAIGLLDRERDYARRSESVLRDTAQARKEQIVRTAEAQAQTLRNRLNALRQQFIELAEGRPSPAAQAAWTTYEGFWALPPEHRLAATANGGLDIVPPAPDLTLRALRINDIAPGLAPEPFARFVANAIAARRDAALWSIEDRLLSVLDSINRSTGISLDPQAERPLVMSVVVPPLALSFGAIGIIANATALLLLMVSVVVAWSGWLRGSSTLRGLRLASVVVPWLAVAAAVVMAPAVPFADETQGFSRIARQAGTSERPLWAGLWLRMIGVEARLLGSMPGRS